MFLCVLWIIKKVSRDVSNFIFSEYGVNLVHNVEKWFDFFVLMVKFVETIIETLNPIVITAPLYLIGFIYMAFLLQKLIIINLCSRIFVASFPSCETKINEYQKTEQQITNKQENRFHAKFCEDTFKTRFSLPNHQVKTLVSVLSKSMYVST